jgi:two-component system, LytTR family, sensor kinase
MALGKLRGRWLNRSAVFGFWAFAGLVLAGSQYVTFLYVGRPAPLGSLLFFNLSSMSVWAAFNPLVITLARRFPFERRQLLRNLLVHVPASFVVLALYTTLYVPLHWLYGVQLTRPGREGARLATLGELYKFNFTYDLTTKLVLYWGTLIAFLALDLYRKYHGERLRAAELQTQLAQAQLQALKMQLQPHFLFNTLNAIAVLIYRAPQAAEQMVTQLSEMLRISLDRVGVEEVTLRQELGFLEKYLEIERTRFQDRLRVDVRVEPRALGACVPNMILQPIVENAVRHGIAPLSQGGRIEIRARREDGLLHIAVSDDGRGTDEGADALAEKGGLGLANTRERLARLYGARHSFALRSSAGLGMTVTITIPYREESEAADGGADQGAYR